MEVWCTEGTVIDTVNALRRRVKKLEQAIRTHQHSCQRKEESMRSCYDWLLWTHVDSETPEDAS